MATLQPYKKYNAIAYDYARQLPDGWQLLPNIAIFQERIDRGHINEELLSVTIGRGVIRQTDVDIKKDSSNEDKSKYKLIKVGDIAYNKMRMWQGALGYSDYQGISSPAYVILKPKMKINPRYFHYMFRTSFYTNYSKRFSYGIVDDQLSLRYTDFKRMYSIVPPLSFQNSIVAYLDKKNSEIDKFIRNKERLIQLLEEQKGINVDNHISNTRCLKSPLKFFCKIITDGSHFSPNILSEGMNYVSVTDVGKNDDLDLDNCKKISEYDFKALERNGCRPTKNDILLTKDGTIGRAFLVKDRTDFVALSSLGIIRPNLKKVNPYLLRYLLISPNCVSQMFSKIQGSALTRLTIGLIKNLDISIPVDLKEQDAIVKEIDEDFKMINLAISKAQKEISSIKEYREALITDLVTGKRSVPQLQIN
jgi:type I restriction enzyme S subunit